MKTIKPSLSAMYYEVYKQKWRAMHEGDTPQGDVQIANALRLRHSDPVRSLPAYCTPEQAALFDAAQEAWFDYFDVAERERRENGNG